MTSRRRELLIHAMRIAAGLGVGPMPQRILAQTPLPTHPAGHPSSRTTARTLHVGGPCAEFESIADAATEAQDGDVVEIAAGRYPGDVAVWLQRRLTIRGCGGAVWIDAAGRAAEAKAIWVIRHGDFDIEGISFANCRVPHRNGAGIRFERGTLRLADCSFVGNETGLLAGNHADSTVDIVGCRFTDSGTGDGYSHNLYVGAIDSMTVRGSYFARCDAGHLLKSRARVSHVLCNRLTDEPGGRASYEVDLPNGGEALLLGNLIVQEHATQNRSIVSFGAEGYRWPRNSLTLAHNTIVNRRPRDALFVNVRPGVTATRLRNNVFVGDGGFRGLTEEHGEGNVRTNEDAFRAPQRYDFGFPEHSPLRGRAVEPASIEDASLRPRFQYVHPMRLEPLEQDRALSPGAFQD